MVKEPSFEMPSLSIHEERQSQMRRPFIKDWFVLVILFLFVINTIAAFWSRNFLSVLVSVVFFGLPLLSVYLDYLVKQKNASLGRHIVVVIPMVIFGIIFINKPLGIVFLILFTIIFSARLFMFHRERKRKSGL